MSTMTNNNSYQIMVNDHINTYLSKYKYSKVAEAMLYAINNGGKRIRPLLLLSLLNDLGYDPNLGINMASAIEMIHTYSLIHDDLPAMDDALLRRNNPTVHVAFDEATAILAGDGLLTEAFKIACNKELSDEINLDLLSKLVEYSGITGMIYGQEIDLACEKAVIDVSTLEKMHYYKTGRLISLPLVCAVIIASCKDLIDVMNEIGSLLGLAFQIQDDIFDVTKSQSVLGKSANTDSKNNKNTYVSVLGLEQAEIKCNELFIEIQKKIETLNLKDNQLSNLVINILNRTY